jgi:hypothetical protein
VQHPRRIANPTGVHGHVDDLALHLRRLPRVGIVQQEGTTRTALLAAAVPLLALPGLTMADDIRALTVGTVQDLNDHDATQLLWGYCTPETPKEDSTSTPLEHLPLLMTDDRDAYNAAVARGMAVTRTLRVLEIAAEQDLLDFPTIVARLRAAGFYMPEDVVDEMLARDAARKAAAEEPPPEPQ